MSDSEMHEFIPVIQNVAYARFRSYLLFNFNSWSFDSELILNAFRHVV